MLPIDAHQRWLVWIEGELYPRKPTVVVGEARLATDNQMRIEIRYLCSKHRYIANRYFKLRASALDAACYGVTIGAVVIFESY